MSFLKIVRFVLAFAMASVCWGQHVRPSIATRVSIPAPARAFASDGEHIYIGYQGGISQIRMSDNAVVRHIELRSATPTSLCWDGASLWYTVGTFLYRDLGSATIVYSLGKLPLNHLAFDGALLWISAGDSTAGSIMTIEVAGLSTSTSPIYNPNTAPQTPPFVQQYPFSGTFLVRPSDTVGLAANGHIYGVQQGELLDAYSFLVEANNGLWGVEPGGEIAVNFEYKIRQPACQAANYIGIGTTIWATCPTRGIVQAYDVTKPPSVGWVSYSLGGSPDVLAAFGGYIWVGNDLPLHDGTYYVNKM